MSRLTAEQVAKNFEATAIGFALLDMNNAAGIYRDAAKFVRDNLVPRWQAEPYGNGGLVWVEFSEEEKNGYKWGLPFSAWKECGEWWIEDADEFQFKLNGRRVCPIGERPKDGEDAA